MITESSNSGLRSANIEASFVYPVEYSSTYSPSPERCLEGYHLHRTRFELIAERKVRRRQLTDDGNVEITGRDLREREVQPHFAHPIGYRRVAS